MARKTDDKLEPHALSLFPGDAKALLNATGATFINRVGYDVIKEVILAVLCGENLRDSTEMLTRRRLGMLNGATLVMFLRGCQEYPDFMERLPHIASKTLTTRLAKSDKWILQWLLGLTEKARQNVLRDRPSAIDTYRKQYVESLADIANLCATQYGSLSGNLCLGSEHKVSLDWSFLVELMATIGAQTLSIRGSEKSTYGKLFERLILGSVLSVLGFEHVQHKNLTSLEKVFWLTSPREKRESDATALVRAGKGVRFDIGFIGRGNPEITLDKVTRFERHMALGNSNWYMATIIIVDTVGQGSGIEELAQAADGTIIQMSMSYWPKHLAKALSKRVGHRCELAALPDSQVRQYLKTRLDALNIQEFI